MDDIHLEDPRKYSAKQIREARAKAAQHRSVWQYLFDLFVKTLICAALISLDFTLFANAGSYNLFSSSIRLNIEAEFIYLGIVVISFILMFIASFFRWLENVVLSLCFALMTIAVINQFALFEKQSVLLVFFNGIFSDTVNVILYEYALWIVGLIAYIAFWLLLKLLRRSFLFYFMIGLFAVLGWILSEAYLNTSSQYFRTSVASPTLRSETFGENLVFLSFNSLTSPNNLRNMYQSSKQHLNIKNSFDNALGFYQNNNFKLYPNAVVQNPNDPFMNLIAAYNPDSGKDASAHILNSVTKDTYFDFTALQTDKLYLKDSSLYDMLRKDKYNIHVYQTRAIDTCYLNNKISTSACMEKINTPISLTNGQFSIAEKTILLAGQWLNSMGLKFSLNSVLTMAEYIPFDLGIKPLNFDLNNLYALNSFKVLDLIIEKLDQQSGRQAYFAVIDLPSESYFYDEFCQLKPMGDWISEANQPFSRTSIDVRRSAYADQVSCLYGYLEKFMQQLDKMGQLEDTTVVIEGLNVPLQLNKIEKDYYRQIQAKSQVALAIRPADSQKATIDYSVCSVDEILNSYFFTHKRCTEFGQLKTTDKNMVQIKKQVEEDKYKKHTISTAQKTFKEWFAAWTAHNSFESKFKPQPKPVLPQTEPQTTKEEVGIKTEEQPVKVLNKAEVAETVVEDIPEEKMQSISVAGEKDAIEEIPEASPAAEKPVFEETAPQKPEAIIEENTEPTSADLPTEVLPDTLFDEIENETENEVEASVNEAIARAKQAVQAKAEQRIKETREAKKELNTLIQSIDTLSVSDEYKDVLQAPVAEGQKLSPEELKKQYHKNLKRAAEKADKSVNIEVKVIEN